MNCLILLPIFHVLSLNFHLFSSYHIPTSYFPSIFFINSLPSVFCTIASFLFSFFSFLLTSFILSLIPSSTHLFLPIFFPCSSFLFSNFLSLFSFPSLPLIFFPFFPFFLPSLPLLYFPFFFLPLFTVFFPFPSFPLFLLVSLSGFYRSPSYCFYATGH